MNIKLTQGKFAEIDDDDFDKVSKFNWYAINTHGKWYAATRDKSKGRKVITLHRFIMNAFQGEIIDHKNGNGLNCKKENLRKANHKGNSANKKSSKKGTSKYLGVCLNTQYHNNKQYQYWVANITHNKKTLHIGSFKTEIEAAKAYDNKAKELHREFANLNFKENL